MNNSSKQPSSAELRRQSQTQALREKMTEVIGLLTGQMEIDFYVLCTRLMELDATRGKESMQELNELFDVFDEKFKAEDLDTGKRKQVEALLEQIYTNVGTIISNETVTRSPDYRMVVAEHRKIVAQRVKKALKRKKK